MNLNKFSKIPAYNLRVTIIRSFSVQHEADHKNNKIEQEWKDALPYSKIPGPSALELITRAVLPGGKYKNIDSFEMQKLFQEEYGNLTKIPGLFGKRDILITFSPENAEKVFRTEGKWPVRRGLDTLEYYRKNYRADIFKDMGGLVMDQGETWFKLRSAANPVMLQPKIVNSYIPVVDEVARDFVEKIKGLRKANDEMPDDFGVELNQWALESIGTIALEKRLGVMTSEKSPEVEKLNRCLKQFFKLSFDIEMKPSLWRYYKTKDFKLLMQTFDELTEVIYKFLSDALQKYENDIKNGLPSDKRENSILAKLLEKNRDYAVLMTFDMLSAGIDTTSSATTTLLYQLAKNPDKQEKLREEILKILPNKDSKLDSDSLNNVPYLKACIKESMRIQPVVGGTMRATGQDIVLEGYQIPKNTDVAMSGLNMSREEKYFKDHEQFIPERWLREPIDETCPYNAGAKSNNPFVFLPFGFGARTCIGKRFAEIEIETLTARILREFKVEWHHPPIEYAFTLLFTPSSKLNFRFININLF